ncbi:MULTISPECIES: hypothetical protein [unclassified Campylobacter]|uniref:hypothetical protein n=1 Tax=unclassified Campylobacter TaxID=2593542 RepID=UPI0022EA0525|nr:MULTISPECIES: hypothetical protein [unclassified Campylobacter]MDA3055185.1 hypothetical protein [Campylobacter sp. VBCF_07 NA4]MDA3061437.1 hypothetical protein [Campylobacter sp. VBCF_02 NA5]MDA3070954.1 hypothetical protein [Campylobacter sp. VBCF_08 NA3]WBR54094.1 hypothetical protein PF027_07165 [Campylobacter sp. VBCF_01 NA2]
MKSKILGLTFLLFGLSVYADSNDLLKFKLKSQYDDKYNEMGTSISISAKDDVIIEDIIINRKKCGLIWDVITLAMAKGYQALGVDIHKERKPMKHVKMEFGDTMTVYTACNYDKILEVKIKTDKGEFVIDEFGLDF